MRLDPATVQPPFRVVCCKLTQAVSVDTVCAWCQWAMVLKTFYQMNSIFAALKPVAAAALLSAAWIAPALAGGYTTSVTDTVKLDVQGAGYSQTRTGSSYSASGTNVGATVGGLGTAAAASMVTGAQTVRSSSAPTITSAGTAFSFAESAYVGDTNTAGTYTTTANNGNKTTASAAGATPEVVAVDSNVAGTIAPNSSFGQVTVSTGGVAGSLAGTLPTSGVGTGIGTVTAGGAGTSATLQRSIDLTVFQ